MKSPEYVATVTKIYRKYIDLAYSNKEYKISENDKLELLQVYNRGMSSLGHLDNNPNRNLVYKEKPNNMGLYLGKIQKYNKDKGLITLKIKNKIAIGDTISIENESGIYTISELMENNKNITKTKNGDLVTIGRMKGNINLNNKVYKMSSKELLNAAKESYRKENIKIPLNCKVIIKKDTPISINITSANDLEVYKNLNITYESNETPLLAKNKPLTEELVYKQINKTSSTPYTFKNISITIDDGLFIPKISSLNELRRIALENVQNFALSNIHRNYIENTTKNTSKDEILDNMRDFISDDKNLIKNKKTKTSILLNNLNLNYDYSMLEEVDNIYIPLKYFSQKKYENILKTLCSKASIYIYMPTIIKGNYKNLFYNYAIDSTKKYDIRGFVISNVGNIKLLNDLFEDLNKYFKIVANYTFNVFNSHTILELKKLGISKFVLSPELDKDTIINLCKYRYLQKEIIVYGRTPLLNMNYCLLRRNE